MMVCDNPKREQKANDAYCHHSNGSKKKKTFLHNKGSQHFVGVLQPPKSLLTIYTISKETCQIKNSRFSASFGLLNYFGLLN
jgi:hypothetical protein